MKAAKQAHENFIAQFQKGKCRKKCLKLRLSVGRQGMPIRQCH